MKHVDPNTNKKIAEFFKNHHITLPSAEARMHFAALLHEVGWKVYDKTRNCADNNYPLLMIDDWGFVGRRDTYMDERRSVPINDVPCDIMAEMMKGPTKQLTWADVKDRPGTCFRFKADKPIVTRRMVVSDGYIIIDPDGWLSLITSWVVDDIVLQDHYGNDLPPEYQVVS